MIDANIINEAYNELNPILKEDGEVAVAPTPEVKKDPKLERIRKLVNDISNIIYKLQDTEYDKGVGKEDDDIRDEMKKSMSKAMYKMVKRLKGILDGDDKGEDKEEDKKEEKEEKKEDKEDEEEEDKEEEEDDENEEEDDKDDKKEEGNFMKLFPTTENITSPQGKKYIVLEANENKSLIKDIQSGEKFSIETNILLKWKNN